MDELFFNNFSIIDGTNRFSINAGTYCVFSNLTFLFVWTNVYYNHCEMTPILISDNRFLSSELDLRILDMIFTNTVRPVLQRQIVPWPRDTTRIVLLIGAVAEARCALASLSLCWFLLLHWRTIPNALFFSFLIWHCWPCSCPLSPLWLCCGKWRATRLPLPQSAAICLSMSRRATTIQLRRVSGPQSGLHRDNLWLFWRSNPFSPGSPPYSDASFAACRRDGKTTTLFW